ncbi:MAG: hypothetical protein NVS3B21_21330 [Acidimicrobiales bacterium]
MGGGHDPRRRLELGDLEAQFGVAELLAVRLLLEIDETQLIGRQLNVDEYESEDTCDRCDEPKSGDEATTAATGPRGPVTAR